VRLDEARGGGSRVNQGFIGALVKKIREQKGLNQTQVAKKAGLRREYISQLENGKTKGITLKTAQKLAKGLGVRPEMFLSTEDSRFLYFYPHIFEAFLKQAKENLGIGKNFTGE